MEEVLKIYGEKTYSSAVNRAMQDAVRMARLRDLHSLFGNVEWTGDLGEMREDHKLDEAWLKPSPAKSGK